MEDIRIVINRSSRLIKSISKRILGNDGENLQENLVFSFEDEFVNGQARLEYQLPNDTTGWLALTEGEETYQIPVRNVLMSEGTIYFQLVVTEGTDETSIPLFKSNIFKMKINESLNTVEIEAPDGYATWLDLANTKLNQMDNFDINVSKVGDTATIEVTNRLGETTSASIKDGETGATGPQGIQGVPGYTPVKGVDYYTESEKQEMINYIINDSESEFNQNAAQKTEAFNDNVDSKTLGFNQNATNKTNDFNTNATNKTTTFDNNASAKTTTFNENASSKTTDFNSNASTKTTGFDSHVTSKTTDFDTHVNGKVSDYDTNASAKLTEYNSNHTSKLQEYNDNAQDKIDDYDEHVQELNDRIDYLEDEVNDLSDNQLIAEEEGTEIYVTDAARARLNEFKFTKESSQVTTTGKNLLNIFGISGTSNGVTYSVNSNGKLVLNGTCTSDRVTININSTSLNGTYTFSKNNKTTTALKNVGGTNIFSIQGLNISDTKTINDTITQLIIYDLSGKTFSNQEIELQIEEGSTPTDYEPYTGGEASPSPDYPQEVEVVEGYIKNGNNYVDVKVTGKNLWGGFAFSKTNNGINFTYNKNGSITASGTASATAFSMTSGEATDYYKTLPAGTYTISGGVNVNQRVQVLDSDGNEIASSGSTSSSFTLSETKQIWIRIRIASGEVVNATYSIQLKKGSVATSNEPYKESIVPIPLNGNFIGGINNYLDELIVDKFGKCWLNKKIGKITFNGSENGWAKNGLTYYISEDFPQTLNSMCSHFIKQNNYNWTSNDPSYKGKYSLTNVVGTIKFMPTDENITTTTLWKNWLSTQYNNGTPVIVYYALATPELIDLHYTIDLKTFKGVSNIINSENANMKIRYVQDINSVISEMKNAILEIGGE